MSWYEPNYFTVISMIYCECRVIHVVDITQMIRINKVIKYMTKFFIINKVGKHYIDAASSQSVKNMFALQDVSMIIRLDKL